MKKDRPRIRRTGKEVGIQDSGFRSKFRIPHSTLKVRLHRPMPHLDRWLKALALWKDQ